MLRTTLKNLAARKLRLLTTSFAVLLGVAFMAGTLVLTDTIGTTFDGLFADANEGTDAVVRGEVALESDPARRAARPARRRPRRRDRERRRRRRRRAATSRPTPSSSTATASSIGNPDMGAPVVGGIWLDDDGAQPVRRRRGPRARPPTDEVVIDRHSADVGDLAVGDTVTVLTQAGAVAGRPRRHRHLRRHATAPAAPRSRCSPPRRPQTYLTEPGRIDDDPGAAPRTA